jgi:hypothetical protein
MEVAAALASDKNMTEKYERFYEWHVQYIRNFTNHHPSITYVEVSIEDPTIGETLQERIGISSHCWGHHNSHEKRLQKNPRFRKEWEQQQQQLLHYQTQQPSKTNSSQQQQ